MIRPGRTDVLLLLGMMAGAALAAQGIVRESSVAAFVLPADAVAVVNGQPVSRAAFDTAVGLVERDRGARVTEEERQRILDRLVDEELLLQRGLELGLLRSDRKLRGDLVASVIDAVAAGRGGGDPSPEQLAAFFETNRAAFAAPAPLRVAQVFVATGPRSGAEAAARAEAAVRRLRAGEDIAVVRRELGDPPAVEVPSGFVPASRLRDTLGPTAAEAAQRLEPGQVSEPLRADDGFRVVTVLERGAAPESSLDSRREEVVAEYRRRLGEQVLRDTLDAWRKRSEIRLADVREDGGR